MLKPRITTKVEMGRKKAKFLLKQEVSSRITMVKFRWANHSTTQPKMERRFPL